MDIRDEGGSGGSGELGPGWHYFIIVLGLIFAGVILLTIFGILKSVLDAGIIPFIITVSAVWGFIWFVRRLVYVGRRDGWFKKIENW